MTSLFILLQGQSGGGGFMSLLPLLLIVVVIWLFMIRPQTKRASEEKKFRENLQQGDRIVTIGGIHGKIVGVQDTTFLIEVEGGTKLKIEKSAVSMNYSTGAAAEKK